jgi:hypothetical protein
MTEKKKVSLAEAMKQRLEQKKAEQAQNKQDKKFAPKSQNMKSQLHKKASSTRRKMGS